MTTETISDGTQEKNDKQKTIMQRLKDMGVTDDAVRPISKSVTPGRVVMVSAVLTVIGMLLAYAYEYRSSQQGETVAATAQYPANANTGPYTENVYAPAANPGWYPQNHPGYMPPPVNPYAWQMPPAYYPPSFGYYAPANPSHYEQHVPVQQTPPANISDQSVLQYQEQVYYPPQPPHWYGPAWGYR